ncbi:MAG: glycosyltransferase family 2 protein [Clostridia bacterium]|nr:glycosyltransferase family 2 protein [Clostridia bacterium]
MWDMRVEVLVSAMHRDNLDIYYEMNLQTDAVIINQCDVCERIEGVIGRKNVKFYSFDERGIGRSRNQGIINSSGDICVFADEDCVFVDGYEEIIQDAFTKRPEADAFLFRVDVKNSDRPVHIIRKNRRMRFVHAMRYGIVGLAVRRECLLKKNVWFSLLFGGGARYGSGEDTIFLTDLLRRGAEVYMSSTQIAETDCSASTWFNGFNSKYFFDKGALHAAIFGKKARLSVIVSSFRWCRKLGKRRGFLEILKLMNEGISDFLGI